MPTPISPLPDWNDGQAMMMMTTYPSNINNWERNVDDRK